MLLFLLLLMMMLLLRWRRSRAWCSSCRCWCWCIRACLRGLIANSIAIRRGLCHYNKSTLSDRVLVVNFNDKSDNVYVYHLWFDLAAPFCALLFGYSYGFVFRREEEALKQDVMVIFGDLRKVSGVAVYSSKRCSPVGVEVATAHHLTQRSLLADTSIITVLLVTTAIDCVGPVCRQSR